VTSFREGCHRGEGLLTNRLGRDGRRLAMVDSNVDLRSLCVFTRDGIGGAAGELTRFLAGMWRLEPLPGSWWTCDTTENDKRQTRFRLCS